MVSKSLRCFPLLCVINAQVCIQGDTIAESLEFFYEHSYCIISIVIKSPSLINVSFPLHFLTSLHVKKNLLTLLSNRMSILLFEKFFPVHVCVDALDLLFFLAVGATVV